MAQTLTCNIKLHDSTAVNVLWMDKDGTAIEHDEGGYTITQGTVDGNNIQKSTLTITAATLQALTTTSPVIWKCSATLPDSEQSTVEEITVSFLILGL